MLLEGNPGEGDTGLMHTRAGVCWQRPWQSSILFFCLRVHEPGRLLGKSLRRYIDAAFIPKHLLTLNDIAVSPQNGQTILVSCLVARGWLAVPFLSYQLFFYCYSYGYAYGYSWVYSYGMQLLAGSPTSELPGIPMVILMVILMACSCWLAVPLVSYQLFRWLFLRLSLWQFLWLFLWHAAAGW
jgi:hypothetical protein